jgi:hypothetical protein
MQQQQASAVSGILYLAGTYLLAVITFLAGGAPGIVAVFLGGTYALSAIAAFLFARGLLEFVFGSDRQITFFVVLRQITNPFLALIAPLTPGFLMPFAASLYAAFLFFFLKLFLFGDAFLGLPPLLFPAYLTLASLFGG